MTDAEKMLLRDAIAGVRSTGAKIYLKRDKVLIRATPEQKERITSQVDLLRQRKRKEIEEIAACLAEADDQAESIEDNSKPVNFIPRDGLLARCVRMLRAEGYSQARIARELRLNKRTVACLLQPEAPH